MFFRKKIMKSCSYCLHAARLDEESVLCTRKGVRPQDGRCWRFRYDPCKRIPARPKALDFSRYRIEDFTL